MGQGLDAPGGRRVASDGLVQVRNAISASARRKGEWVMEKKEKKGGMGGRCALPGNSPLLGFSATLRGPNSNLTAVFSSRLVLAHV